MQTIKPRAVFVPSTGEWIVKGCGIVKIRSDLDVALQAWRERFFKLQLRTT